MNSVAGKKNLLKQVIWFAPNVLKTRFFYQAANYGAQENKSVIGVAVLTAFAG